MRPRGRPAKLDSVERRQRTIAISGCRALRPIPTLDVSMNLTMTWRRLWPPLLVATLAMLAFLPTLRADFVNWDDEVSFLTNLQYRGLGPAHLHWMFTTTLLAHWSPLPWMSREPPALLRCRVRRTILRRHLGRTTRSRKGDPCVASTSTPT
jgi:hypothetical protein